MLTPDQFHVNQALIVMRVNDSFLFVQNEPYDIFVLMDAASTFVLGNVLSRVVDEAPSEHDVKDLFKQAWGAKHEWAKQIIITEHSKAEEVFIKEAKRNGMTVRTIPLPELEPIVGPLKESFASDFMGDIT